MLFFSFFFFFLNNNVETKSRGDSKMTRNRILLDQENSLSLIKAYIKESHCFFFTYYIEKLLNFSIPMSHISKEDMIKQISKCCLL